MRLIIDGTQLFVRIRHASDLSSLSDRKGRPTGTAWGFLRSLLAYRKHWQDHVVHVCWDGTSQRRKAMRPEYKANRVPRDYEDGFEYLWLRDFLPTLGVTQHINAHEEADDVMASLAAQFPTENVIVATTDRDMLQLVSHSVQQWCPPVGHNQPKLYDLHAVLAEYGVLPERVIDVRALCGDHSDNIAGVPGIGIKTAIKAVCALPLTKRQEALLQEHSAIPPRNRELLKLYTVPYDTIEPAYDREHAVAMLEDLDIQAELLLNDAPERQLALF